MQFLVNEVSGLQEVADYLVKNMQHIPVWLFNGEMGAGKTTLIKVICATLQVSDVVSSPTFSIVNEYMTINGETIYHFDLYRIRHQQEALDIGAEEYLYSGDLCLLEWSEKIPSLLPPERVVIDLRVVSELERDITVSVYD